MTTNAQAPQKQITCPICGNDVRLGEPDRYGHGFVLERHNKDGTSQPQMVIRSGGAIPRLCAQGIVVRFDAAGNYLGKFMRGIWELAA